MTAGVDEDVFAQLVETVDRFARERLIPAEHRVEAEDEVPEEIVGEMKAMGLFGLSTPEEFGGIGLSVSQEAVLIETLCYASLTFRSLIGTNVGIGSQGIVMDGTAEQKARWLPGIASGEVISAFALTEPDNGSDAGGIRTMARRDGDDYVIDGTKRYITNAVRADVFTVYARTDPEEPGANGVSAFIVPADTPGIQVGKPDRKLGQRGTKTSDVVFDGVRVPAEAMLGGPERLNRGFRTAMKVLDRGRIHIGAMSVGQAQRMLDIATDYALERRQFGVPIGEHQLVQGLIADCQAELQAGRALVRSTAATFDREGKAILEAACTKYFCTEMAGRVADRALQIHGGAGYMAEYDIERLYRDVRLLRIYEGTSQIQQLVIARRTLAGRGA
ncbi:acyl-CoA dehydrogenase family protein [Jannaschia rubra]|uniref:Cyclohexane-1-carbonyl-CoA dehydrogenase n=1 Tax=Jannaschia rubra TaxID=282197 RepID=A0A0M6XK01_9RHOB|nr:acyl-CoA dehydrogenase family protein [Jannaschia rubra]CTQ31258.1 Acyl-CoA dehydrogenase [Jannaschia rubra]SFF90033.1 acyl-CoA dehydrogenase [Jannaschia rubra]